MEKSGENKEKIVTKEGILEAWENFLKKNAEDGKWEELEQKLINQCGYKENYAKSLNRLTIRYSNEGEGVMLVEILEEMNKKNEQGAIQGLDEILNYLNKGSQI